MNRKSANSQQVKFMYVVIGIFFSLYTRADQTLNILFAAVVFNLIKILWWFYFDHWHLRKNTTPYAKVHSLNMINFFVNLFCPQALTRNSLADIFR